MRNSVKISAAALAATALVSLSSLSASAVDPVALPNEGDRMFVFTCDSEFPFSVGEMDVLTGDVTPIGDQLADGEGECWAQGAYNPADGLIYSVDWNHQVNDRYELSTFDPNTGEITAVGTISDVSDGGSYVDHYAIAISPEGDAYVSGGSSFYSLDLATGDATYIGDFTDGVNGQSSFYSFAFNPIDGLLYAVNWGPQDVYTVDLTDGTLTLVDDSWNAESGIYNAGLTFDSNGLGWFQYDGLTGLFTADITDIAGTITEGAGFTYLGENFYSESITIVPAESDVVAEEALAETGLNAGFLGAAGAAFALAAAGVAVARTRRN